MFHSFTGYKNYFFFSNWQTVLTKWKNSSYLTPSLGWLHAPVGLCGGWASTSRLHRVLSLWSRSQQPMTSGDLKWKKRVGFKISHMLNGLCHSCLWHSSENIHTAHSKPWILSTFHGWNMRISLGINSKLKLL